MAAQPSGVSTTPPSLVSSANLLRVHSNSSSRSFRFKSKTGTGVGRGQLWRGVESCCRQFPEANLALGGACSLGFRVVPGCERCAGSSGLSGCLPLVLWFLPSCASSGRGGSSCGVYKLVFGLRGGIRDGACRGSLA